MFYEITVRNCLSSLLPHYIVLINLIKNIKYRFTKRLYGWNDISYSLRLELCHLHANFTTMQLCSQDLTFQDQDMTYDTTLKRQSKIKL